MRLISLFSLLLLWAAVPSPALEPGRKRAQQWEDSIVILDVARKQYDYLQPWSKRTKNTLKAGIVIGPTEILTTADELADRTLVRLQKGGRGKWSTGEIVWIDYPANLAIVTASDPAFWKGLRKAVLADRSPAKQDLQVVRWRKGNLEVRKAEFNQFTVGRSELSYVESVQMELSSDIDGAGWGEPVISGDKVIGLMSSKSGDNCRVIPAPFVHAILEARKKGAFRGLGYFDFVWQPAENPATLQFLKLEGEPRGVIVTDVPALSSKPTLKPRDIILKIDQFPIDIQGDYEDPDYGHLSLENLATRGKWAADNFRFLIWREGKLAELDYTLPKADNSAKLLPELFDQEPEYYIAGGLVFQPLSIPYLRSWGSDWERRAPFRLAYCAQENPTKEFPARLILSAVLPDPFNLGYQDYRYLLLERINGAKVSRLPELIADFEHSTNQFHVIEYLRGESLRRMVLDASEMKVATSRVLKLYGIEKNYVVAPSAPPPSLPVAAR